MQGMYYTRMFFLYYILMREACGFSGYVIGSNDCIRASLTCLFPGFIRERCPRLQSLRRLSPPGPRSIPPHAPRPRRFHPAAPRPPAAAPRGPAGRARPPWGRPPTRALRPPGPKRLVPARSLSRGLSATSTTRKRKIWTRGVQKMIYPPRAPRGRSESARPRTASFETPVASSASEPPTPPSRHA